MRQLVDAACKALSPAVNDPYTAIQAVEHLSVLYAALADHGVGSVVARDASDQIAVAVPGRSLAEHLALGFGLIRRYGAAEPTVVQALLRPLSTVLTATDNDPAASRIIEGQAELLLSAAQRKVAEPADLDLVTAEADSLRQALASHQADTWQPGTPPPT